MNGEMKFVNRGRWVWRDIYRLVIAYVLSLLVKRNYKLRMEKKIPDKWYWADIKLLELGYAVLVK